MYPRSNPFQLGFAMQYLHNFNTLFAFLYILEADKIIFSNLSLKAVDVECECTSTELSPISGDLYVCRQNQVLG